MSQQTELLNKLDCLLASIAFQGFEMPKQLAEQGRALIKEAASSGVSSIRQKVHCPNCGCDYQTAKELREWKDETVPGPNRLDEASPSRLSEADERHSWSRMYTKMLQREQALTSRLSEAVTQLQELVAKWHRWSTPPAPSEAYSNGCFTAFGECADAVEDVLTLLTDAAPAPPPPQENQDESQ